MSEKIEIEYDGNFYTIDLDNFNNPSIFSVRKELINLRILSLWYRDFAKKNNYETGIYRKVRKTYQWKQARKLHIKIARKLNNIPENKYIQCIKCGIPTAEWNLELHHEEYNWDYIFDSYIKLICKRCHRKIHGVDEK